MPDYIPPEMWPPNSPDLNPLDYGIWESFMRKVYKKKISDVETLKTVLEEAWEEFPYSEINEIINQLRKRCNKVKAVKLKGNTSNNFFNVTIFLMSNLSIFILGFVTLNIDI